MTCDFSADRAAVAMRAFGDALTASLTASLARLTPEERREYDRLCPSLLLPFDALHQIALARRKQKKHAKKVNH